MNLLMIIYELPLKRYLPYKKAIVFINIHNTKTENNIFRFASFI